MPDRSYPEIFESKGAAGIISRSKDNYENTPLSFVFARSRSWSAYLPNSQPSRLIQANRSLCLPRPLQTPRQAHHLFRLSRRVLQPRMRWNRPSRKRLRNISMSWLETMAWTLSHFGDNASDLMAIPIVGIVFTTLFGAPVLIVAVIMMSNYFKSTVTASDRSHDGGERSACSGSFVRTAASAASPFRSATRHRFSNGRLQELPFSLAADDWEGGSSWSLGVIPFLIGVGYLIVWKLEGKKDNPPPAYRNLGTWS